MEFIFPLDYVITLKTSLIDMFGICAENRFYFCKLQICLLSEDLSLILPDIFVRFGYLKIVDLLLEFKRKPQISDFISGAKLLYEVCSKSIPPVFISSLWVMSITRNSSLTACIYIHSIFTLVEFM